MSDSNAVEMTQDEKEALAAIEQAGVPDLRESDQEKADTDDSEVM